MLCRRCRALKLQKSGGRFTTSSKVPVPSDHKSISDRWTFRIHFGSDEILAKSIVSHLPVPETLHNPIPRENEVRPARRRWIAPIRPAYWQRNCCLDMAAQNKGGISSRNVVPKRLFVCVLVFYSVGPSSARSDALAPLIASARRLYSSISNTAA
jgi:hypothetical protein